MTLAEEDDVVGDALDVRDHVRGDHDRGLELGDPVHQELQELAGCERVEALERLVEEDQRRPLPECDREREAAPFARRQRRHALVGVETGQVLARDRPVPARIRRARELDRVAHGEGAVQRGLTRDEPDAGEDVRLAPRIATEHLDAALRRCQQPDRQAEERRLPRTVRAREPDDRPLGDLERAVAQRPASPVALPHSPQHEWGAHATRRTNASRRVVEITARMLSSSRPARSADSSQRSSSRRSAS